MPLTFIHTADWHLGHTYWRIGPRAVESAQWRLDAVRRIWSLAAEKNAAFILVAGDVFDSDTPSQKWRRHAVELLADAPAPVVLISGNHDPCAEGSIWQHPEWLESLGAVPNVRLAMAPEPCEIAGALIFPCPVTRKHSREDLTAWIPDAKRGDSPRIGLAHGGWNGYFGPENAQNLNGIDARCAERAGLDYLALGDYHSFTPADHRAAKCRTFYAGTPEIGARDNVRGGHALVVTLDGPNCKPLVEPHFVGRVQLEDWGQMPLDSRDDLDALRRRADGISNSEDVLLRVKLEGTITPSLNAELELWLSQMRERLLGADVSLDELHERPERGDFRVLRLERLEEAILDSLGAEMDVEALGSVRGGEQIAYWSSDEAARREALALYYRLLKEAK